MFVRSFKFMGALLLMCTVLSITAPNGAIAGPAEKREKIIQLMKSMDIMAVADAIMPAFSNLIVQSMQSQGAEVTPGMSELITKSVSKVLRANQDGFMEELIKVYDQAYTEPEVNDIVAFYQSPTGKKTIRLMPELMQRGQVIGMQWGQSLAPQIEAEIKAAIQARQNPKG